MNPSRWHRLPWALIIALTAYVAAVTAYVWVSYWSTDEYRSARAWAEGARYLGHDEGRTCSRADFLAGYRAMLESARLSPGDVSMGDLLQRLRWRAEERHFALPVELVRKTEAVSATIQRAEQAHDGWLPVGARDRGWAAEQLLQAPAHSLRWAVPGALLIIGSWAYAHLRRRRARTDAKLTRVRNEEADLEALGAHRRVVRDEE